MALHWRDSLQTLLTQFQARASRSSGIYHMMVEVTDSERDKMSGPSWFQPFCGQPRVVDGPIIYERWDCSRYTGLPGVEPGFREPLPGEEFGDSIG